ncbi:MAG: hypothetical protein WAV41_05195 [Microgenomates group bacterium]
MWLEDGMQKMLNEAARLLASGSLDIKTANPQVLLAIRNGGRREEFEARAKQDATPDNTLASPPSENYLASLDKKL